MVLPYKNIPPNFVPAAHYRTYPHNHTMMSSHWSAAVVVLAAMARPDVCDAFTANNFQQVRNRRALLRGTIRNAYEYLKTV